MSIGFVGFYQDHRPQRVRERPSGVMRPRTQFSCSKYLPGSRRRFSANALAAKSNGSKDIAKGQVGSDMAEGLLGRILGMKTKSLGTPPPPARSGPSCARIGLPIAVVPRLLSVSVANPEGIRDDASQMVGAPDLADGGEEKAKSCTPPVFISWAISNEASQVRAVPTLIENANPPQRLQLGCHR
jgi:hypothetical protein